MRRPAEVQLHQDLQQALFEQTCPSPQRRSARGEFPSAELTLVPDHLPSSGTGERVGTDRVFWPNIATDTELVAAMLPAGLETFHLLRSHGSRETLGFSMELPEGCDAQLGG